MKRTILCAAAMGITACSMGPRARKDPVAQGPRGADVVVTTTRGDLRGELLAVTDSTVIVLVDGRVWHARFGVVHRIAPRGYVTLEPGRRPLRAADREWLRLRSRFPQGVDARLLATLLAAYRQDSVMVVRQ